MACDRNGQQPAASLPSRCQHIVGVLLVISVSVLWVLSAILIQSIFGGASYDKPYFLTYFSTSLFSICLIGFCRSSWRTVLSVSNAVAHEYGEVSTGEGAEVIATTSKRIRYTAKDVFMFSARITPIYFAACWTYNAGLSMTSVASSSTLNTLTTLFALLSGACIGKERVTLLNLFGTILTITGVVMISTIDRSIGGSTQAYGDVLSLLSSVLYAWYAILVKNQCDAGEMDIAMMQAFLGLIIVFSAWPGFFLFHALGWETFELPDRRILGMLFINGLVGTVLSEFIWAKSVVLTTPLIGSLALSLLVPLSLLADYVVKGARFSFSYLAGTCMVLAAFLLINLDLVLARRQETHTSEDPS